GQNQTSCPAAWPTATPTTETAATATKPTTAGPKTTAAWTTAVDRLFNQRLWPFQTASRDQDRREDSGAVAGPCQVRGKSSWRSRGHDRNRWQPRRGLLRRRRGTEVRRDSPGGRRQRRFQP